MKTKHIWASEDVMVGMIVCRAHRDADAWKPCGWKAKWTYKIGFVPGDGESTKNLQTKRYESNQYCQIAMTDGMVQLREMSRASMAVQLTKEDMIPMPYSWWLQMVRFLRRQTMPDAKMKAFNEAHS